MNIITIAGNIGKDARINSVNTATGPMTVANFAVAVKRRKKDADTLWVDCSIWGKRAESLGQYLTKGSKVTVCGEADIDSYQDGQGQMVPKLTVNVQEITLMGSNEQQASQQAYQQPQQQMQQQPQGNVAASPMAQNPTPQQYQQAQQQNYPQGMGSPAGQDDIPF